MIRSRLDIFRVDEEARVASALERERWHCSFCSPSLLLPRIQGFQVSTMKYVGVRGSSTTQGGQRTREFFKSGKNNIPLSQSHWWMANGKVYLLRGGFAVSKGDLRIVTGLSAACFLSYSIRMSQCNMQAADISVTKTHPLFCGSLSVVAASCLIADSGKVCCTTGDRKILCQSRKGMGKGIVVYIRC